MFTLRLMSAATWGLGIVATIDVLIETHVRLDRALVAVVCVGCGALLYALEPLLVKWLIEKPLQAEPPARSKD